jgi:hypothetical protein
MRATIQSLQYNKRKQHQKKVRDIWFVTLNKCSKDSRVEDPNAEDKVHQYEKPAIQNKDVFVFFA